MAALLLASLAFGSADERVLYATRTFFGVYRVSEDRPGRYHGLAHGTTLHGMQALAPERRAEALTYFHETGPFGQAWHALPRMIDGREIAVVGLGVGTLATYARPTQHWTFFEIDPAIEQIARTPEYFSFMDGCADRCRVVIGDARVSLGRVPEHAYDLLVIDAFSSDSIPMHLMTREAIALYTSRLAAGRRAGHAHLQPSPDARADRRPPRRESGTGRGAAGRTHRTRLARGKIGVALDRDDPQPGGSRGSQEGCTMVGAGRVGVGATLDRRFFEHPERPQHSLRPGESSLARL